MMWWASWHRDIKHTELRKLCSGEIVISCLHVLGPMALRKNELELDYSRMNENVIMTGGAKRRAVPLGGLIDSSLAAESGPYSSSDHSHTAT